MVWVMMNDFLPTGRCFLNAHKNSPSAFTGAVQHLLLYSFIFHNPECKVNFSNSFSKVCIRFQKLIFGSKSMEARKFVVNEPMLASNIYIFCKVSVRFRYEFSMWEYLKNWYSICLFLVVVSVIFCCLPKNIHLLIVIGR